MDNANHSDSTSILHKAVLAAAFALALLGAIRIVSIATDSFIANVIVDDAIYYAIPAQNLIAHRGYTFDGHLRTNGVQPLWAFVTIGLAALIPDPVVLLRALSLTSGLCWIAAGWVLYLAVRSFGRWTALFVAVGWLFTGFWNRLAFQGMENGLHALLCALLLEFGARTLRPGAEANVGRIDWHLRLGLLLALLTVTRVDTGLLAVFMGLAVLFGLVRYPAGPRRRLAIADAIQLATPGILLVGGCLLLNYWYFGTAMPISGQVKMFYESTWAPQHGNAWRSLLWHAHFLIDISTEPLARNVEQMLWNTGAIAWPAQWTRRTLLVLATLVSIVALIKRIRRGAQPLAPWTAFVCVMVVFAVSHFIIFAVQFAHFTGYGSWYFAPEIMVIWMAFGFTVRNTGMLITFRRAEPRWLLAPIAIAMFICAWRPVWFPPAEDVRTSQFLRSARWLNQRLPAKSKLGAFSAGILCYFTRDHQVFNLDGLMNTREYLDEYVKPNRIPDYTRDRGIQYLCDYAPLDSWRSGVFWGFHINQMELVRWWRMDGGLGYGVWRLRHDGKTRGVLDPPTGWCDRLSQIRYAAEVEGRSELIPENELEEYVRQGKLKGKRLFDSLADPMTGRLRHIMIPEDQLASLAVTPRNLDIPISIGCTFGDSIELLGADVSERNITRGEPLVMTRYWRVLSENPGLTDASLGVYFGSPDAAQLIHKTRGCHDTRPIEGWQTGEIVIETYRVELPRKLRRGVYPIIIRLEGRKGPVPTDRPGSNDCPVANIEVR